MNVSIKTFLPRTLFGRSMLILVTPVILIQLISVSVFFDRHYSKMTERLAMAVASEIAVIAGKVDDDPKPVSVRDATEMGVQYLGLLVNYDKNATITVTPEEQKNRSLVTRKLSRALDEQVRRPYSIKVDLNEKWVEVGVALKKGVLTVFVPQERLFSSTAYIFLLWMIFSSIILLAIAVLFMRNQIRPIRRLAIAAERIGKGRDLPANFKPEGAREVRQAARAFIDMHDRIKRQIAQRTAMLAGVSHDLRTPLTRLKLQAAMLNTPDAEAMKGDIDDMQRMLNGYLDFVRGEGGEASVRTDLREVIDRVAQAQRRSGATVEVDMSGDLTVMVRALSFERCLNNIIGNARKYAPASWLRAGRLEDNIVITVDDNGPGIPDGMIEDVFKPFVRVDPSRNPNTGGIGLGLTIAQDIVHSHGGEILLSKSDRGGLRVTITLPV
jgi:two-component system osmolarity sensor histidine kinase EnvZ